MILLDCILSELKRLNAAADKQNTKLEVVRETASQCARELYNVKAAVRETVSQQSDILRQMADDLTCMEAELAAVRGSMAERETQPDAEPEDTKQITAEQDRLSLGLNNLLNHTLEDHLDAIRKERG